MRAAAPSPRRAPAAPLRGGRHATPVRRPRAAGDNIADTGRILANACALYEQAWSSPSGHALLKDIVADAHEQRDEVWQHGVGRVGRDKLAKGMRHMRRIYPDLAFTVTRAAAADAGHVFVEWAMSGTFEGEAHAATGVSLLTFDADGRVARTQVYRQALPAEVVLAQRSAAGEVEQGVLLARGGKGGGEGA